MTGILMSSSQSHRVTCRTLPNSANLRNAKWIASRTRLSGSSSSRSSALRTFSKDQAETSVLFELIGTRYERRSMLITANQPFGEWGKVFPDQAMTLAAIDRLVHHSTIFEMNVESYRHAPFSAGYAASVIIARW